MAKICDYDEAGFAAWLATRPEVIRRLGAQIKPAHLYRNKKTGQYMTLAAWSEDGTVRMDVPYKFNGLLNNAGVSVFGMSPDDLEECDLPDEQWTVSEERTENGFSMRLEPVTQRDGD